MKKSILFTLILSSIMMVACSGKKPKNNFISTRCDTVCDRGECNQVCTTIEGNMELKKVKK